MTPSNALSWLDKRGTVSADAQWAAMGSSEALSAAAVPGEELLAPAQSSMFTLPEEDIGPGGTLSADAQWAAMVSAKTLWAATELAAQSSTFTVPVEVIVPEKSTPLADTIRTLLFEEAFAADEELKARRKWLARKDPVACLHQLRRLNRSLLADTKRRLDNHLRLAYALRLQRRWRGKLNPGTVAAAVARNAQTVADDRSRVHAALKWLKRQRLMLRAEARSIASEVLPRQENRALGLRRRLVASEYQREKDENAGAALPRDRRASSLEHPVFKVVRKTQEELLGVEATTRTIQQILAEEFDIMPRRLTAKERRRSVMHSPAGVTAAALAQRRLGGSTVAGPPPGRAWEEGERRRLASEKALAAKRARARSEQEAVEQDKAAVLDAQDRCAQVQAQLDEYRRRPRRSSSAASQRQVTMACGAAPTLAASAASPALAEAAEAAEAGAEGAAGAGTEAGRAGRGTAEGGAEGDAAGAGEGAAGQWACAESDAVSLLGTYLAWRTAGGDDDAAAALRLTPKVMKEAHQLQAQLAELLRQIFPHDPPLPAAVAPPDGTQAVALRRALAHSLPDRVARLASLCDSPAELQLLRDLSKDLKPALVRRAYLAAEQGRGQLLWLRPGSRLAAARPRPPCALHEGLSARQTTRPRHAPRATSSGTSLSSRFNTPSGRTWSALRPPTRAGCPTRRLPSRASRPPSPSCRRCTTPRKTAPFAGAHDALQRPRLRPPCADGSCSRHALPFPRHHRCHRHRHPRHVPTKSSAARLQVQPHLWRRGMAAASGGAAAARRRHSDARGPVWARALRRPRPPRAQAPRRAAHASRARDERRGRGRPRRARPALPPRGRRRAEPCGAVRPAEERAALPPPRDRGAAAARAEAGAARRVAEAAAAGRASRRGVSGLTRFRGGRGEYWYDERESGQDTGGGFCEYASTV